jgi:hypothetical protein
MSTSRCTEERIRMALSGSRPSAAPAVVMPRPGGLAQLEGLLRRQHELFAALDALSSQQASLIEEQRTDRLLEVLAERQVIIDSISRLNADIDPWRAQWSDFLNRLPEADRQRIRQLVDGVAILAEGIAARDDRDRSLMEMRKGALAAELGHISRGRGAIAAYGSGPAESPPRFQDREA